MGAAVGNSKGPISDINVTPLIDVVLVLLVVFMVITPMLQSGQPVDLPEATQTKKVKDSGENIVISITENNGWWVESTQVDKDTIIDALNAEYQKNATRPILLKADRDLEYKAVREVLDVLGENNFTSVMLAASKEQ